MLEEKRVKGKLDAPQRTATDSQALRCPGPSSDGAYRRPVKLK